MAKRDSIIEKIKALLAKTTENGATEAEMLAALDKASAMMDAYDITDDEVREAKEEKAILHADPPNLKDSHKIKWRLSDAVAEFCGVEIFRSRHQTGLKCIGMPSDVQFAMWLLDSLADFLLRNCTRTLSDAWHHRASVVSSCGRLRRRAVGASVSGCMNW
jgi:Protein of unknown function (DUF2786)